MVSHEFRTPLAAISSSMEIIDIIEQKQNNSSSSKISEHLSKANLHLSRLTELLDEVLLLNDIENDNLVLSKTEFELKDLILEIKKNLLIAILIVTWSLIISMGKYLQIED